MPTAKSKPVKPTKPATPRSEAAMIKALLAAVGACEKTTAIVHDAIFGRWDEMENRQVVGLREDFKAVKDRLDLAEAHDVERDGREEAREKRNVRIFYIGAALSVVVFLKSLGVPTDQIGHAVSSAASFWGQLVK
jgi:hypothetical protein